MDITVYLPDELGSWAKDAGINFSATLRGAVQSERTRAAMQDAAGIYELVVQDPQTRWAFNARFHGTPLHDLLGDTQAYLSEDGKVWIYEKSNYNLYEVSAAEEAIDIDKALRDALRREEYIEAMAWLGHAATIDVGQAVQPAKPKVIDVKDKILKETGASK